MKSELYIILGLAAVSALPAQVDPVPAGTTLPPVTVTASGTQNPSLTHDSAAASEEKLSLIPGNVSVTPSEEFREGRASTLEDVFRETPGVMAAGRGSDGDEVKLSIRGSGLDLGFHLRGLKLLLDGVPLSFADGFGDFQSIDPLSLSYIEVYRGSNALRYGATTLGGAINFVSPTGYDADALRLRFEAGSYGYLNGQVSTGGVSGAADYYLSLSAMTREGFQDHGYLDSQRFYGNVGYKFSEDAETRLYLTYVRSRSELPGNLSKDEIERDPRLASPDAILFDQARDVDFFRIANKTTWRIDDVQSFEAGMYYSHFELDHPLFWNPYFLNGLGVRMGAYDSFGAEFRYLNEAELLGRKNRLTLGFAPGATLIHDERLKNDAGRRGKQVHDGRTTAVNYDFYAENQHWLSDKLSFIAGFSSTYAERNFEDRFLSDPNGDVSRDQNYTGFSPKLGLLYDVTEQAQVFGNVSRSFEPPTAVETVGLGGVSGNVITREIDAQTATTFEIGTRGTEGRMKWELAYYYSRLENELLSLNDAAGNPLGTVNGPDTVHQGVELGLDFVLLGEPFVASDGLSGDRITLKQIFNWNDFRFRDSDVYGDNRLAGAPEFFYRAELLYESPSGIYFGPNVQWVSRTAADYANSLYADGYATLGLRIGYRSPKGWTVFAEARNLTNEKFASSVEPTADAKGSRSATLFHPGEPASVYAGFELKF